MFYIFCAFLFSPKVLPHTCNKNFSSPALCSATANTNFQTCCNTCYLCRLFYSKTFCRRLPIFYITFRKVITDKLSYLCNHLQAANTLQCKRQYESLPHNKLYLFVENLNISKNKLCITLFFKVYLQNYLQCNCIRNNQNRNYPILHHVHFFTLKTLPEKRKGHKKSGCKLSFATAFHLVCFLRIKQISA